MAMTNEERVLRVIRGQEVDYLPSQITFSDRTRDAAISEALGLGSADELDGYLQNHLCLALSMHDKPLTKHPQTGEPVQRIPQAPNLPLNYGDAATKSKLSDANLDRLGFTKYQNAGDGHFEKKAGSGPDVISAD